jgi:hypothetical protein
LPVEASGGGIVIEAHRLCHVAARRANPHDVEAGRKQVDAIAERLVRRLRIVTLARILVGTLAAVALLIGMALFEKIGGWAWLIVTWSALIVSICLFMGKWFQTRRRFFVDRPYDAELPEGVEHLLEELASGRIEAWLELKSGLGELNVLRTANHEQLDRLIARDVFTNRYAPILLSSEMTSFDDLWMPKGHTLDRPIYVIREAGQAVEDAPPAPHWIARIPRARFAEWMTGVIERGGWRGLAEQQMATALQTAHRLATERAVAGEYVELGSIAEACVAALREHGIYTESRPGRKGGAPIATESLVKIFGSGSAHTYKWVRESAAAITGLAASDKTKPHKR